MVTVKNISSMSIAELQYALELGELTPSGIVEASLNRISELNDQIKAFVAWNPDKARKAALEAPKGPLYGIPFGVKDVLDTIDYPTAYGSSIYTDHQPASNAACVNMAHASGAVLLGKVATGEFATQTPSAARNPLRTTHTPGGSSSGSAAAVAAGMVPFAFGTQTTASIVRPAIYCGVSGFKPTLGYFPAAGLKALSPMQDTIGLIAATVPDIATVALGLHGQTRPVTACGPLRIAVVQSRQWDYLRPGMANTIERYAANLSAQGHKVHYLRLPATLEVAITMQPRLFMYEARLTLSNEYTRHKDQLSVKLRNRLDEGRTVSFDDYMAMRSHVRDCVLALNNLFEQADLLLYPAAAGEADEGLESAGDARFGALWTLMHAPSVSFPVEIGASGLPLGVQLIGKPEADAALLSMACLLAPETTRV